MKRAIIDSRPFLLLSLIFGISYFFLFVLNQPNLPDPLKIAWKGAGVAFLAVYALRRVKSFEGKLIAAVMAFGSLGDMLIELDMIWGAGGFIVGHCIAITLYLRHRPPSLSFSQKTLAIILIPSTIFISWALPYDRNEALGLAAYSAFLAIMAALAWTSSFPRYRVGVGALLFILSDLFIFSRLGFLQDSVIPDWVIWPTYYAAQFLIATGVVQTLRKQAAV